MGCRQLTYQNKLSPLQVIYNAQKPCSKTKHTLGQCNSLEENVPFLQITTPSKREKNGKNCAESIDYRYTGMERDEETGLSYHNARYYIPWLGRWLNADPIGIGDGVNVYAYCGNNPINHTDSGGMGKDPTDKSEYTRQDNAKFVPRINPKALMEANQRQAAQQNKAKETAKLIKAFGDTYEANNPGFTAQAKAKIAQQQKKAETATRVQGALQVVGGAVEAVVGGVGGVVTSETGAGAVVGGALLIHGSDNMAAGINKMLTGKPTQTQFEQLVSSEVQKLGVDKATADYAGALGNNLLMIAGSSGNVVNMVDAAAINSVKPVIVTENAVQGATVALGDLKFSENATAAANRLGFYPSEVSISNGVADIPIMFTSEVKLSDISTVAGSLKSAGATSMKVNTGPIINTSISSRIQSAYDQGKSFLGFNITPTGDPNNMYILEKAL
jgi:RHS repeat-associated protein